MVLWLSDGNTDTDTQSLIRSHPHKTIPFLVFTFVPFLDFHPFRHCIAFVGFGVSTGRTRHYLPMYMYIWVVYMRKEVDTATALDREERCQRWRGDRAQFIDSSSFYLVLICVLLLFAIRRSVADTLHHINRINRNRNKRRTWTAIFRIVTNSEIP